MAKSLPKPSLSRTERVQAATRAKAQAADTREASDRRIQQILSESPGNTWAALFPLAHLGRRHIRAYLGPTNSGKTWNALQALSDLRGDQKGVYLAPLRLLAIEVCDELRAQGIHVSLITGEERDIDPEARVVCSTVEMLNSQERYQVAVIDEIQMIADTQRGWAWTQALFGLDAAQVYVLGSPSVTRLLHQFVAATEDQLTLVETKRFTPLTAAPKPVPPKRLTEGTIFVVFSRNSVIRWGEYFRKRGHSVAQIYGAMPPEVRREEARRFRAGESEILVATDAVSMGLNLPAHTVVVGEGEKYDGRTMSAVPGPLMRQIAGRAGRFGHHDQGVAAGIDTLVHKQVETALKGRDPEFGFPTPSIAPTRDWVELVLDICPDLSLYELLKAWQRLIEGSKWFTCMDLRETFEKAAVLDSLPGADNLPMMDRLLLTTAPVDLRQGQIAEFRRLVTAIVRQEPVLPADISEMDRTDELESAYKKLSLYCWMAYRYPESCPELELASALRQTCVDRIIDQVKAGLSRYCSSCGVRLSTDHDFGICASCYAHRQQERVYDRW